MLMEDAEDPGPAAARPAAAPDRRLVLARVTGRTREEVLEEIAARLAGEGWVRDPSELVRSLLDRERLGCTGLGGGIAIPHCKLRDLSGVVVVVASTETPIDFGASDGVPVDLIFLVASPAEGAAEHLQTLARLSRVLRTPGVVEALRDASSPERLREVLRGAEAAFPVPQ